jgi:hypothetical protein
LSPCAMKMVTNREKCGNGVSEDAFAHKSIIGFKKVSRTIQGSTDHDRLFSESISKSSSQALETISRFPVNCLLSNSCTPEDLFDFFLASIFLLFVMLCNLISHMIFFLSHLIPRYRPSKLSILPIVITSPVVSTLDGG